MRPRRALCLLYLVIAVVALVGTWLQNWSYVPAGPAAGVVAFWWDATSTPASRSLTIDILLFYLSAAIWMVSEARRLRIRWVGLYLLFGLLVAISVTFPLFLVAREKALADSGT